MNKFPIALALILFLAISNCRAAGGFSIGAGLIYNPTAKLEYFRNHEADYQIVDNIVWEPRLIYDFENGFRGGVRAGFYKKRIFPGGSTRSDITFWNLGFLGEYGYEITETGRTLVLGGMEIGYGNLTDKSNLNSATAGSFGVAAFGGVRHLFSRRISLQLDYRLGWLEFDLGGVPEKKYNYSGSGLRLAVDYQFHFRSSGSQE
jgi:opacity protein-like surface antigen